MRIAPVALTFKGRRRGASMSSTPQQKWCFISAKQHVGGGYHIQFKALPIVEGVLSIACEWSPRIPCVSDRRHKINMRIYADALAQFVQSAEQALGDTWEVT